MADAAEEYARHAGTSGYAIEKRHRRVVKGSVDEVSDEPDTLSRRHSIDEFVAGTLSGALAPGRADLLHERADRGRRQPVLVRALGYRVGRVGARRKQSGRTAAVLMH